MPNMKPPTSPRLRPAPSRQRRCEQSPRAQSPLALVIASALLLSPSARSDERRTRTPIPDSCPVTLPSEPRFIPSPPYNDPGPDAAAFWHGSDALFVTLYSDGRWRGITEAGKTRDKLFWFRKDAKWLGEYPYPLLVTARRLDADAPMLTVPRVTNAIMGRIESLLVMLELPTGGCWQVTGNYKSDYLTFVVWVD